LKQEICFNRLIAPLLVNVTFSTSALQGCCLETFDKKCVHGIFMIKVIVDACTISFILWITAESCEDCDF
jgi:hypothetical protein